MFTSPAFLWGVLGVVLIAAEMLIPGFVIFFFGAGALITALLSGIIPAITHEFVLQALVWVASSVFSLVFLRRRFSRAFRGTVFNPIQDEDVGKTAVVTEAITPENPGRVRYQGTTWKAISYTETFSPGEKVEIIKEENLTLVVTAPILPEEDRTEEE
jgi:membrane protein implicated in regulation of membrane protease activity